ncbi:MAG: hypothetical protein QXK37_02190 [Candidatus Woesearchaeota archaeon]
MKRAQITMFILVGLVVMFAFAAVLYLSVYTKRASINRDMQYVSGLFSERGKYHNYITSCVEQVTKESLVLVGLQGGVIYDTQTSQGRYLLGPERGYPLGKFVLPYKPTEKENLYLVSYGITAPVLGSQFHPEVPYYPYGLTKLVTNPLILNPSYVNTLGNFPSPGPFAPLCDSFGANRQSLAGRVYTCESYDSANPNDHNSVQEYLQSYIANKTFECVKLETIPELLNMSINKGNVTANLTFGDSYLYVSVVFPVVIEKHGIKATLQLSDFNYQIQVRLKRIHELASHLIKQDTNNIFFNIVKDASTLNDCKSITGSNIPCLMHGMHVSKLENVCRNCTEGRFDDILVIKDNESLIDGLPYTFVFAIENRPPALDLIRQDVFSTLFSRFDFIVSEKQEIHLNPMGYDPDEEYHNEMGFMDMHYTYELWKETYDEYFLEVECTLNQADCLLHPERYVERTLTPPPKNFTKSQKFRQTNREATYKTTHEDIGLHTLKISVCDEEHLCDYQMVSILVQNKPILGGFQPYDDIPWNVTSIEDYYYINIFLLGGGLEGVSRYLWSSRFQDPINPHLSESWTRETTQPNLTIPWSGIDIRTILNDYFLYPGLHEINVSLYNQNNEQMLESNSTVDVKMCVAHRADEPPWPYNGLENPFMGNHSCCLGVPADPSTYQIASTSSECYRRLDYGCKESFQEIQDPPHTTEVVPNIWADDNDIYERAFVRYCDGRRGNTCNGSATETIRYYKECDDWCQYCLPYTELGSENCANKPEQQCGLIPVCTIGPGQNYDPLGTYGLEPPPDGPKACTGMCTGGTCTITGNCACNVTECGAQCDSTHNVLWEGDRCSYGCNQLFCTFDTQNQSICTYPLNYCFDPTIGYCITNVECRADGVHRVLGDVCMAQGQRLDAPGSLNDICFFYNNTGHRECAPNGRCLTGQRFPEECNNGNPLAGNPGGGDNFCSFRLTGPPIKIGCYYSDNLCMPDNDGWDFESRNLTCAYDDIGKSCLNQTGRTDTNGDVYDICIYNIICNAHGLSYTEDPCYKPTYGKRDSGVCYYENAGIINDRSDDCAQTGCTRISNCTLRGGQECTSNGCVNY